MPSVDLDIPVTAPSVIPHLEETHVRANVTPNDSPVCAFDLLVPKTWAFSSAFGPTASGLFETQGLGFFASSPEPDGPVIAATVTVIPFEIPIDTWVRLAFREDGWEIVQGNWFPGPFGLYYDITGVRRRDEKHEVTEVRRTSVRVRETHVFSVNTLCGAARWNDYKEIFWVAHSSFEPTLPAQTRMEQWHGGVGASPDFQIAVPASWNAEAATPEPDVTSLVDVRLLNPDGDTLLAYLQVKAERRKGRAAPPPLTELESSTLALLVDAGLEAEAPPRELKVDEDPRSEGVEGWLGGFASQGMMKGGKVYARTGFMDRSGVTFTLTLLSPLLEDDPLVAMRAQRAFEIARSSLVTPP